MKLQKKEYTIGEWLDVWFDVYAKSSLKSNTIAIYADARRRIARHFPETELRPIDGGLSSLEFQSMLNTLAEKYARSTLRHAKILYNKLFSSAVSNHLTDYNPIPDVTLPIDASVRIVEPLSVAEQEQFVSSLHILRLEDDFAIRIFLLTGLRLTELRMLRWEDWDTEKAVLIIRESKTETGIRNVPVLPDVGRMLQAIHDRKSASPKKTDYVFQSRTGGMLNKAHYRGICNRLTRYANMRHVTPHMLRHTFATRMVEAGADPKSLSLILGHRSVVFTLKTYVMSSRTKATSLMQ